MASALLEELQNVATEVKRRKIENAVGTLWAALAAEEDSQGRGRGTLLNEAKAEGGRGGGLKIENNGRIPWQPSSEGRMNASAPCIVGTKSCRTSKNPGQRQ